MSALQEKSDASSLEAGGNAAVAPAPNQSNANYVFNPADLDRVQRRLKQRHIQMIAIAGTLGTGLFLGSGEALSGAGPLGALVAYALVGSTAYSVLCCLGEMTSHAPISGTFPHFAGRWVDPALGFAVGWNYFWTNAITIPTEISGATLLLTLWDPNANHQYAYITVVAIAICAVNIFGVRWYGESEFGLAIIKLILITGLLITGLVIDLGGAPDHDRRGFRYWNNPGAVARAGLVKDIGTDRFLGILSVIVQAAFSFQGIEIVAIAASETENPRRNVATAVRRVFWRIVIFYMLGIVITGMIVPYNDPNLLQSSGTAAESPYVIAMTTAGIKVLPSIVNAAFFTSAFSAGSSYMFTSSRVIYGLALRGQAPRILAYCTKNGLPIVAVAATAVFVPLAYMEVSQGASTVFNWFVNLTTVGGFLSWATISLTYIYFYRGMKAQGIDRTKLVYHSSLQPWIAYWGLFWNIIFTLINGFEVFFSFNTSDFLTAYLNIPIFVVLYVGWKLAKKTKFWKPEEMDFVTGIPTLEETEMPVEPPTTLGGKIMDKIF